MIAGHRIYTAVLPVPVDEDPMLHFARIVRTVTQDTVAIHVESTERAYLLMEKFPHTWYAVSARLTTDGNAVQFYMHPRKEE